MVEDESRPHRCLFCNSLFSVEILSKIEDDKGDVYCENCGDIIKRVNNKYNFNPPEITENESKTNIKDRPVKHRKELKPNPDALNYPIGRVFYDTDFPLTFKSNFIIVFSRLICYSVLRLENAGHIDLGDSEPSESVINDLYMATRLVQNKRVKSEFLKSLREISIEEFEDYLKKFQAKIQSNRQYLEDFHVYSRWLIRRVFCIIAENKPDDQLTKFEKTILNDLHILNIDGLKLPAIRKKTTYEKNGELENTREDSEFDVTQSPQINSITYEDYLSLIEMRKDITVGMSRVEFYTTLVSCGNTTQSEIKLKWKCTKKKHAWQASYHGVRTGDGCPRCPKASKLNAYNTLDLIEDLRNEVQIFSEELAQIFPNRLVTWRGNTFGHNLLAQLWGKYAAFVKHKISSAKKNPDYIIDEESLLQLEEKLEERLGARAMGCVQIIRRYQRYEINTLQFVDMLEKELGRVSGEIRVTDKELSLILTGTQNFIKSILSKIRNPSRKFYNPLYKFSKERIGEFRAYFFDIFGSRAKKCFDLLERYKNLNLDLKEYSRQQFTITRPNYFKDIEEHPEKSYWYGFLRADGSRSAAPYGISLDQAVKDKDRLEQFAKAVGLPLDRIMFRIRYLRYKGELKIFYSAHIKFVCKPMAKRIDELGFLSSEGRRDFVPNYVVQALKEAKRISKQTPIDWWLTIQGKVALAFLLGFYDGDGTYVRGKSAEIYSSSEQFLEQIRELFEIKNFIRERLEPGEEHWVFDRKYISKGFYSLTLGPNLFDIMIDSYKYSMVRKRPQKQN